MIIIPAIDLLEGECVRLHQGRYSQATVYYKDPVEVARLFESAGAKRIHIVDLNAARGKGRSNRRTIKKIRQAVACMLEVGGGIRTDKDVLELIEIGIDRLVLGTVFANETGTVAQWINRYGKLFMAGIDAFNGDVRISGWEEGTGITDTSLAVKAKEIGIASIIYTNISKDGTLEGPDIKNTRRMARLSGLPLILSGGIGSEKDIMAVIRTGDPSIVGIITGKALYEGKFLLEDIIKKYQNDKKAGMEW
ncbi:MAG: 1-(5-phosphoribosyl)-5-[(5-phosphoribosylamino)methylideneamino]imidazole-4-carboxamide isomerase [Spirochaetota bacterium]